LDKKIKILRMNIYLYYKSLRKPYFDFLEKYPKAKFFHVGVTLFLSGWTFKTTSQEAIKLIKNFLAKKN